MLSAVSILQAREKKGQTGRVGVSPRAEKDEGLGRTEPDSYFFFDIFRLISSMSLGRRSARTLSTMLATLLWSPSCVAVAASCKSCSAPAATARAAVSGGVGAGWSTFLFLWLEFLLLRCPGCRRGLDAMSPTPLPCSSRFQSRVSVPAWFRPTVFQQRLLKQERLRPRLSRVLREAAVPAPASDRLGKTCWFLLRVILLRPSGCYGCRRLCRRLDRSIHGRDGRWDCGLKRSSQLSRLRARDWFRFRRSNASRRFRCRNGLRCQIRNHRRGFHCGWRGRRRPSSRRGLSLRNSSDTGGAGSGNCRIRLLHFLIERNRGLAAFQGHRDRRPSRTADVRRHYGFGGGRHGYGHVLRVFYANIRHPNIRASIRANIALSATVCLNRSRLDRSAVEFAFFFLVFCGSFQLRFRYHHRDGVTRNLSSGRKIAFCSIRSPF